MTDSKVIMAEFNKESIEKPVKRLIIDGIECEMVSNGGVLDLGYNSTIIHRSKIINCEV